ncbi:MAG: hypothetical protein IJ151_03480 [Bacteroidales bacterium]|nr:hypothetical protein [Bacteroidales bacterium]
MTLFKRVLFTLALLAAGAAAASAQEKEIDAYEDTAGWDLPLYRGKQMPEYNFRFNGTYYWDNLGYRTGDICYGGKVYRNILMNIDANRQAVYARFANRMQIWELDRDLIEWLTLDNTKFLNLRYYGVKKAPEGFFEVLREGPEGYNLRQVTKSYRESIEINGYYRIGYEDPDYNNKIFVFFSFKEQFFFVDKNWKLEKFGSLAKLFKKHPNF